MSDVTDGERRGTVADAASAEQDAVPDAVVSVLDVLEQLRRPLTPGDVAEVLTTAGVPIESLEVARILEGSIRERVERLDDGRWRLMEGAPDADQQRVIDAPTAARLLVVAGPGAGKTEVACGRVAAARALGAPARGILMISFTRAATAEVRSRLERFGAARQVSLRGVDVRTLDSLAWTLQRNLRDADLLTGSYADNIERMLDLLLLPPAALAEHLQSLHLVVIDEAQDIVGRRSDLAIELIRSLPASVGVTVFADPAQAIYGDWALDEAEASTGSAPLHERLASGDAGAFEREELRGSHRTDNPELQRVAEGLREYVLVRSLSEETAYSRVREGIAVEPSTARQGGELASMATDEVTQFFLFRTHGEVAQLSSYLSSGGIPHRLRFPGLPVPVEPWIGRLLYLGADRRLPRAHFDRLWTERVEPTVFATTTADDAWERLIAIAGDSDARYVDIVHLREILSRRNPPDEVLRGTVGRLGPIVGTIHGAKGREADDVVLGLGSLRENVDHLEEARVLYVGATRARKRLRTAEVTGRYGYLRSRRAWHFTYGKSPSAQIEFGLDGDIDPVSPVSFSLGGDALALDRQEFLATSAASTIGARWDSVAPATRGGDWLHVVSTDGGDQLAACGDRLTKDLWELVGKFKQSNLLPPDSQRHLYVVDHTTVARDDDSPDLNRITGTFARSGFWVAPIIKAFSVVYPRWRRR